MEQRYSRQILFNPIGAGGQASIQHAVITIIGCGALGSAIAESMARAGVGEIHLVDRDYVEFSNLQRQQLFTEEDAHAMTPKVVAAEKRLKAIRKDLQLHTYLENLDAALMETLIKKSTLVMDATDNFETRLLINDASVKYGVPWIYGACVGSSGAVYPFVPGQSSCFRCLVPVLPAVNETCDTVGIISPAVQVTAALQCAEAMKWMSGNTQAMRKKVHYFNVWDNTQYDIGIARIQNGQCETCGKNPVFPSLERKSGGLYAVLCGREAVQVLPDPNRNITLDDAEFAAKQLGAEMNRTPYFVQIHAFGCRVVFFSNGRMIIHGIRNAADGRKIYHQLFG